MALTPYRINGWPLFIRYRTSTDHTDIKTQLAQLFELLRVDTF
jgi:hypothetical protein